MLQSIRERAQGWIAWVIVILICIPFALWGINSYFNNAADVAVAEVNGDEISLSQYQNALQNYRQRLQNMLGESVDLSIMGEDNIKQDVINALVEQRLVDQTAQELGMRVSDTQVAGMIHSLDVFKGEDGKFSKPIYERRLMQTGNTPTNFELQLRADMAQDQLRQGVADSAFVTPADQAAIERLVAQQRDIFYTTIVAEDFKENITISDEAIKSHYDNNHANFMTEEQVKLAFINLSQSGISQSLSVAEDELRTYYDENVSTFTTEEKRVAHHVLISLPPDADEEAKKKAQDSAQKIYALMQLGVDVDSIPQDHANLLGPQDEVAKSGDISQGVMDVEFDEALFSMEVDQVHEPVRSKSGYHIIKLVEIKPQSVASFEDSRDQVESLVKQEEAEKIFFEKADELHNLVYEHPDTLEVAADALELKINESALFSRTTAEGVLADPKVITAAFSDDVLQGNNSEPVPLTDTHLVTVRMLEHKEPELKSLDDVKEDIRAILLDIESKKLAEEKGKAILAALNEGKSNEAVAEEFDIEWESAEAVTRDDPSVKRAVLRAAFKLAHPTKDSASLDGMSIGRYDFAVVGVTAIKQPEDEVTGEIRETVAKTLDGLEEDRTAVAWQDFIRLLKSNADIARNSTALEEE